MKLKIFLYHIINEYNCFNTKYFLFCEEILYNISEYFPTFKVFSSC